MDTPLRARAVVIGALAAVLGLAVVLRLAVGPDRTLVWDEAYHVRLALTPTLGAMLESILGNPPSTPLYALFLRGFIGVVGLSDPLIRMPTALFGGVTALATAWLGWELTGSRRVALVAATLFAVAPFAVEHGQEATPYAFAAMWVTLALASGWRWRRTGARADGVLTVILTVLAVYSHYVSAAVLGLAGLLSLAPFAGPRRMDARTLAVAAMAVLAAFSPWLIPLSVSLIAASHPRTALAHPASINELVAALSQYTSGTRVLLDQVRPIQVVGLAAAAILIARAWLIAGPAALRGLRVILVLAFVLFVGPWIASLATGSWLFVAHLMLPLLPAVAVVVTAGALLNWDAGRAATARPAHRFVRFLGPVVLTTLFAAQVGGLFLDARNPPRGNDGVRQLANHLGQIVAAGEPVFITPAELQVEVERYWTGPLYGLPAEVDLTRLYEPYEAGPARDASIARFTQLTAGTRRAWLIYTPDRDADGRFLDWLAEQGELTPSATYPIADVYVVVLR